MLVRVTARVRLPGRALKPVAGVNVPNQTTQEADDTHRTIPHIPREFAKDTIEFFRQSSPHVKSLLDLVFSAKDIGSGDKEVVKMRAEYERALKERQDQFRIHEQRASRKMFEAIQNLPEDMYDEAVRKGEQLPPEALQFHEIYKEQLMGESLSDWELVKLQTFSNLMHIRYSHSEAKKKHKDKFFISEAAALNLRKERAKKEKLG
jgi:hypothetical protein